MWYFYVAIIINYFFGYLIYIGSIIIDIVGIFFNDKALLYVSWGVYTRVQIKSMKSWMHWVPSKATASCSGEPEEGASC
jgi:hypothetical protein